MSLRYNLEFSHLRRHHSSRFITNEKVVILQARLCTHDVTIKEWELQVPNGDAALATRYTVLRETKTNMSILSLLRSMPRGSMTGWYIPFLRTSSNSYSLQLRHSSSTKAIFCTRPRLSIQ